jgi:hypothetical protein
MLEEIDFSRLNVTDGRFLARFVYKGVVALKPRLTLDEMQEGRRFREFPGPVA